jgi:hypothetical protein
VSAAIVDPAHIDVLLDLALQYESASGEPLSWWSFDERGEYVRHELAANTATGQMLLAECVNSVAHCCPDTSREDLPGSSRLLATEYVYRPTGRTFSAAEANAAIFYFKTQSFYHAGWKVGVAKAFCDALRERIRAIAGNDESWYWELEGWAWTDQRLGRVSADDRPRRNCPALGATPSQPSSDKTN